jgi:hypothetical protein
MVSEIDCHDAEILGHDSETAGHNAESAPYAGVTVLRIAPTQTGTLTAFCRRKRCLRRG